MAKTDDFMAMKGAGYYSAATLGAKHVMDNAAPLILDALARMDPKDDGSPFVVTDMGCADGGTSLDMLARVLRDVRVRCPNRPIEMIYTDLPRNDFSQLFQAVHGLTGLETYATELEDVHVYASATSYHRQITPPGRVNLGHSATASHYIQAVPCAIPDHVHMARSEGQVRAAYQAQGAADWQNFLEKRAVELAKGGRLALFNFGIDEAGRYLGNTGGVHMFDSFARLWEATVTAAEFEATNFPQVYRTVEEFSAPIDAGAVGLALEHIETRVVECPFAARYREHGDAARFAREYIPTLRSWSEPVFSAGLSAERSVEERAELIDAFYGAYEAEVAAAPDGHAMDYVHCYMICAKQ